MAKVNKKEPACAYIWNSPNERYLISQLLKFNDKECQAFSNLNMILLSN